MFTIERNLENEIIIKNSRFICYLIKIDSSSIDNILNDIIKQHPKATHYCYGYIYGDVMYSSDDGEPNGTAGIPILNVLKKENLNQLLAVVVRYFGGIKLGAGGLVRAYTKSVTETLKKANCVELIPGYQVSITFLYDEEKQVNYILNNSIIINREYFEDITYLCLVDYDTYNKLSKYHPVINSNIYIEKLN